MSALANKVQLVWGAISGLPPLKRDPEYKNKSVVFFEMLSYFVPIFRGRREIFWIKCVNYWAQQLTPDEIKESLELLVKKNELYGSTQLYEMGSFGILIRSIDKIERIKNIDAGSKNDLLNQESRKDSISDLFNYAILAILVLNKEL